MAGNILAPAVLFGASVAGRFGPAFSDILLTNLFAEEVTNDADRQIFLAPADTRRVRRRAARILGRSDTGHRVIRLTKEKGSASLYFNQNGYTADGKKLVDTIPQGIHVLDLATRQARQVVEGCVRLIDAGRKTARLLPPRRRGFPDQRRYRRNQKDC